MTFLSLSHVTRSRHVSPPRLLTAVPAPPSSAWHPLWITMKFMNILIRTAKSFSKFEEEKINKKNGNHANKVADCDYDIRWY